MSEPVEVRLALGPEWANRAMPRPPHTRVAVVRMAAVPRAGELVTYQGSSYLVESVQHDAADGLVAGVTVSAGFLGSA